MKLTFYPTDIEYTIKNNTPYIQLFGRAEQGIVCVFIEFRPYFYVKGASEEEIRALAPKNILSIERVIKRINEIEHDVLKVTCDTPKTVPILRDQLRQLPAVDVYEADILFVRRYLLDSGITMLSKTLADVTLLQENMHVACYLATHIEPAGDEVLEPRILAVDIETYNPDNRMNTKKHPILMIGLYGDGFERIITWKKFSPAEKYIEFTLNEADMLSRFVELVHEYKPDFIVGYFSDGFDFPYLVDRAKKLGVPLSLGHDGSSVEILGKTKKEAKIHGIAHLDIYKFIRKVIGQTLKTDSFSLDEVSKELLGEAKHPVNMDRLAGAWDEESGKELNEFAIYNLQDVKLTYRLTQRVFPNLIEFVRIIGLAPYDINRMTFSTFVEWYLIKSAMRWNEMIPNKPSGAAESTRLGDRIKGAFVFEPKPGFYKDIMVFDFRSLYPSIIASHNISKGTLSCACCTSNKIETGRGTFWYCTNREGFFSSTIKDVILRRAALKNEMKTNNDSLLYARSNALKLLANSFYGYLGFAPARWYCIECAESTTAFARNYINEVILKAQHDGFTVLYSDTDSVFLQLGDKSKDDALAFIERVNDELPGLMELDFEGHYPAGIFVGVKAGEGGAKKKYALIDDKGVMKIRGFETVRRNWSVIAKQTQQEVLRILLSEHDTDGAKNYVRRVIEDLRANKLPVELVVIKTALSKSIAAYASVGPHVAAAQRMESRGETVGAGQIVRFVIVKGKGRIRDKVRLPDETKQNDYDGDYYVQHQILPGVERIFAALDISIDDLVSSSKQTSLSRF